MKRYIYWDFVRIIACIMVIVMHSPIPGDDASLHGPFLTLTSYLAAHCIPLFFIVSGLFFYHVKKKELMHLASYIIGYTSKKK